MSPQSPQPQGDPDPLEPEVPPFRPTSWRGQVLLVLLTVATVSLLVWAITERPGAPPVQRVLPEDRPRCAEGQTRDCVGGRAEVIVVTPVPVPVPASAASQ